MKKPLRFRCGFFVLKLRAEVFDVYPAMAMPICSARSLCASLANRDVCSYKPEVLAGLPRQFAPCQIADAAGEKASIFWPSQVCALSVHRCARCRLPAVCRQAASSAKATSLQSTRILNKSGTAAPIARTSKIPTQQTLQLPGALIKRIGRVERQGQRVAA